MECGLSDLGFTGDKFTWQRGRGTDRWISEQLDRGFATSTWRSLFPSAEIIVHEVSTSDHMPLCLQLNRQVYMPRSKRFRFENMWIQENECRNIIQECWNGEHSCDIMHKMARCCVKLEEWEGGMIKELKLKMSNYRREMQRLRARRDEGEFVDIVKLKKKNNKITKLKNEAEEWQDTDDMIQDTIVKYFKTIFTAITTKAQMSDRIAFLRITDEQSSSLLQTVTEEEIITAIFAMFPDKSPGINGLNPCFFQVYWNIVK
ncbi:uncharacterized protein LOC141685690 [Apium graveolens]|uniref:uncharacterized protein LOC141685690 n=1 Tax=Apium graveolens TaxID=4045 RepID=UPI003D799B95